MDETGSGASDPSGDDLACCKVTETAREYGASEAVSELVTRRQEGASLRELAAYFNTRVTARALESADIRDGQSVHAALIGDDFAATVYRTLRDDGSSDVQRAELRAQLRDEGVDVDALERAFVSHVTVRTHLQECVNVERETATPDFEKTVNTVRWARTRADNIIQNTLDSAVATGEIQTGDLDAELVVRVTCENCGDTFYVEELLDDRRCSCATSE